MYDKQSGKCVFNICFEGVNSITVLPRKNYLIQLKSF